HGWAGGRCSGGLGMISSWVTDAAPWRSTVPRQSAPVSPPPMITTCRPHAEIAGSPAPSVTARFDSGKYSIAWWMPARPAPGTGRGGGTPAPAGEHDGTVVAAQLGGADIDACLHRAFEGRAFMAHLIKPTVKPPLLHLELGYSVPEQTPRPVVALEYGH